MRPQSFIQKNMFTLSEIEAIIETQEYLSDDIKESILFAFSADSRYVETLTATLALPFGKYKGQTLMDALNDDKPGCLAYCRWLLQAKDDSGALWVLDRYPDIFQEANRICASMVDSAPPPRATPANQKRARTK